MIIGTLILALAPVPAAAQSPDVFEKVRSDGVRVVCVRHVKKPSIVSSAVECRTPASWRNVAVERGYFPDPQNFYPNPAYASVPRPSKPVTLR